MEKKEVMTHGLKFMNGNSVEVSDLINDEAVRIIFGHSAGTANVKTEIFVSKECAKALGQLLVKHHNKAENDAREQQLLDLREENSMAYTQIKILEEKITTLEKKKKKTV